MFSDTLCIYMALYVPIDAIVYYVYNAQMHTIYTYIYVYNVKYAYHTIHYMYDRPNSIKLAMMNVV